MRINVLSSLKQDVTQSKGLCDLALHCHWSIGALEATSLGRADGRTNLMTYNTTLEERLSLSYSKVLPYVIYQTS